MGNKKSSALSLHFLDHNFFSSLLNLINPSLSINQAVIVVLFQSLFHPPPFSVTPFASVSFVPVTISILSTSVILLEPVIFNHVFEARLVHCDLKRDVLTCYHLHAYYASLNLSSIPYVAIHYVFWIPSFAICSLGSGPKGPMSYRIQGWIFICLSVHPFIRASIRPPPPELLKPQILIE